MKQKGEGVGACVKQMKVEEGEEEEDDADENEDANDSLMKAESEGLPRVSGRILLHRAPIPRAGVFPNRVAGFALFSRLKGEEAREQ